MKTRTVGLCFGCLLVLAAGCATEKTVHQRGWIGGAYAQATKARWCNFGASTGPTVYAFPKELASEYSSGVLVSAVFSNTPAAAAGLRPGDLILKIDDHSTPTVEAFRQHIDGCAPGAKVRFTVFREGTQEACPVVVGQERYEKWRSVSLRLGSGSHAGLDLVPNPEFSAVVVGYRRGRDRLELHSPEQEFVRRARTGQATPGPGGYDSAEGWHTWLTVLNFNGYKRILSQEIFGERPPTVGGAGSP